MKAKKSYKKYNKGGKTDPTKKMKKADEAEIDRRYESTVGRNPRTGNLNYPNSVDMDKYESTAGSAGNDNKLRKAVSDKYYAEQRKKMGIDKIKTYSKGGVSPKKSYSKGGDVDPPQKKPVYGPPKPPGYKEPTEKEREESRGEAAYLKRRKEADRAYRQAIKEGATKAQAVKIAEKYLSQGGKMYLTGGKVKLKKK